MKLKGTATVEAALIFPVIFLLLMVFLQYALYFMTCEHVQAACHEGILAGRAHVSDGTIRSHIENVLQHSLVSGGAEVSIRSSKWFMIPKRDIEVNGTFSLFYPMKIHVHVSGYGLRPVTFCQFTDLIWECAGTLREAGLLTGQWFGGG